MFSAKILLSLIASTFFMQYTSQEKQVNLRGTPEVDYPTYYAIPKTSFSCTDQLYNPGFYADTEARCQVFHYCFEHRQESFLCPMGTIFNQPILACDYWYSSNCSLAPSYYNVNAIKRNEYPLDETEYPTASSSENLFDKMADLHESDKTSEYPVPQNVSLNEFSKDGSEPSNEPSTENNIKTEDYNKYTYDQQFNTIDQKHPEIVKYNIIGFNSADDPEGSKNEQPYQTDNVNDFIFSDDGTLHPVQDEFYQMFPTDMNFDQGYNDYADIPSEGNYDLNEDFGSESDFEIPDFELQRRHSDVSGNYFRRRPSNRKPIVIFSEEQPEIVQLPVTRKRKPIEIAPTVSTISDGDSSYETTNDPNIYNEEIVSGTNEDLTTSEEFPLDTSKLKFNYEFNDPNLLYESQEEIKDVSSSAIYDYSTEKNTRNTYVLSNDDGDEISPNVFGSDNDLWSISNTDHSSLRDSKYGDKSEIFEEIVKNSIVPPEESSGAVDIESSFDNESFFGSGLEENINLPPISNILSDSEEIDATNMEASSNIFEGSGVSDQIVDIMPNFNEEVNEPIEFVLKEDFGNNEYNEEQSSFGTFEKFSPSDSVENNGEEELALDGSGEFNYLPYEMPESSQYPMDESSEMVPENLENDEAYYVLSDSEYPSNFEYGESNEFDSETADYAVGQNFEGNIEKAPEDFIDNDRFQHVPKLKIDYIEDEMLHTLDYQGSNDLENTYETMSNELEAETLPNIPEKYIVDKSETAKKFSTEDLKYLEIMAQTPVPILKNLFEVSEKSNSDGITEEEMFLMESIPSEKAVDQIHENPDNLKEVNEFENLFSGVSSENSVDEEPSEIHSKIFGTEQKIEEETADTTDSEQNETEVSSPEENVEVFAPQKETDPFNPLFTGSEVILDAPKSKHQISPKVHPIKQNETFESPVMKDLNEVARGKRSNENLQTFIPPKKGTVSKSKDTVREAIFTNIPSEFLKMKHSTLRPYFYNYGLKNSGFNPRTGDIFGPSKFSKLASLGKRLLAAKSAKFNLMKNYIDSYRK